MTERTGSTRDARHLTGADRGRTIYIPYTRDPDSRVAFGAIHSIYHSASGDTEVVLREHPNRTHTLAPDWPVTTTGAPTPDAYRPTHDGLKHAHRIATGNA